MAAIPVAGSRSRQCYFVFVIGTPELELVIVLCVAAAGAGEETKKKNVEACWVHLPGIYCNIKLMASNTTVASTFAVCLTPFQHPKDMFLNVCDKMIPQEYVL
jgi:hypothetical protein